MMPTSGRSLKPGDTRDIVRFGADRADPVRCLIHITLALYLTPVVLVVCLIGGVSIVVEKAARSVGRLTFGSHHRSKGRPVLVARSAMESPGPRFRDHPAGSRAVP